MIQSRRVTRFGLPIALMFGLLSVSGCSDSDSSPAALRERSIHQDGDYPRFDEANAKVVLHLQSGPAELVIFEGEHDMLYRPGLEWLARQHKL
ncbi:hypothetical protein [Pseudomonas sp. gcc21]|uniref:hypothetical protein n=1 Tax=Pseudomonas sp. gcc21 TaxID=2726989 RepID=UPI0015B68291|nr:hypothetical protein [Pseudomonas sp. gcc21]